MKIGPCCIISAYGVVMVSPKGFKLPLRTVSHRTLNILAALVWYIGGIVLMIKGCSLLIEAESLQPDQHWPWTAAGVSLLIGSIKATFLFSKNCRKNLARIAALDQPKTWQFFKPVFFLFLLLMILTGAALSKLAHGNYTFLLGVAGLDLTIAIALLGSSYVFWQE
jgi:hypothetical protein